MIIVNFKNYPESTGENAVRLAKVCDEVAGSFGDSGANDCVEEIVIAVHPTDLRAVSSAVSKVKVISESGDFYTKNNGEVVRKPQTGRMTPDMVFGCGAVGALVNHAENPRTDEEISMIVRDFKEEKSDSLIVVCAENVERAKKIEQICGEFKPDFIAIEPSELIGGDVSVTTKPEIIREAVAAISLPILVGAGVKTLEDFVAAKELGAKGILLASGIVKPTGGKSRFEALKSLLC